MDKTEVFILGNSPNNVSQKTIEGDFQVFDATVKIGDYTFEITKRLFVDFFEPLIDMDGYLKIEDLIYKVLRVKTFSGYQEFWLYLLDRQEVV